MAAPGTVLADLAVLLVAARAAGALAGRAGQPAVLGELAAGVLLGPTVLGALPGDPSSAIFDAGARPVVSAIGQVGLVLFMFTVGWELDGGLLRRRSSSAATVSLSSILPPAGLGLLLAIHLHPGHDVVAGRHVPFWPFTLFVVASLCITALPVLARIVRETGLQGSELGTLALSAAAVDDLLGWTALAFALAVVDSAGAGAFAGTVAATAAFIAVLLGVVRPALRRAPSMAGVAAVPLALACAAITDAIGIHAVIGAFLAGLAMPRARGADARERLAPVVAVLAPVYFVLSGMSVDLPGLRAGDLRDLVLVLAAACSGKFLGAFGGARLAGADSRQAAALGVLMNTRGLIEIVLLTVGRDAGLIDGRLFTMLAVMALVTTAATPPLLRVLRPDGSLLAAAASLATARRAA